MACRQCRFAGKPEIIWKEKWNQVRGRAEMQGAAYCPNCEKVEWYLGVQYTVADLAQGFSAEKTKDELTKLLIEAFDKERVISGTAGGH